MPAASRAFVVGAAPPARRVGTRVFRSLSGAERSSTTSRRPFTHGRQDRQPHQAAAHRLRRVGARGPRPQGRRRRRHRGGRVDEALPGAHGPGADGSDPAQAQPGRRLRLHVVRVARPRPEEPARRGVLRERRQGRRGGGHQGPGHPRVLRPALDRRPRLPQRDVAGPAGPHHPPDGQATRRHPLRAHRVGRRLRHHRRRAQRPGEPRRGDLLHLRAHLQRGGVRLPALRAGLRHQQPARLLEHVPRVDQRRAGGVDRHRQGQRGHAGRLRRRADRDPRPEPRHQPPAHAQRAGDRQGQRRHHRGGQPAQRGRQRAVQEPADPEGHDDRYADQRPAPAHQGQRRPGPAAGPRQPARRSGTRSTTTSSLATPTASRSGRSTSAPSTGTSWPPPPA